MARHQPAEPWHLFGGSVGGANPLSQAAVGKS